MINTTENTNSSENQETKEGTNQQQTMVILSTDTNSNEDTLPHDFNSLLGDQTNSKQKKNGDQLIQRMIRSNQLSQRDDQYLGDGSDELSQAFRNPNINDKFSSFMRKGPGLDSEYKPIGMNDVDQAQDREIRRILDQLSAVNQNLGSSNHRLGQVEDAIGSLMPLSNGLQVLETHARNMEGGLKQVFEKIQAIETDLGIKANSAQRHAKHIEDHLVAKINQYNTLRDTHGASDQDAQVSITQQLSELDAAINELAREYLEVKQTIRLSVADDSLPIREIRDLQDQLIEVSRSKLTTKPQHASRWAAVTSMFTTDKEAAAFRSAQRVVQNPAFSKLEQRNDDELAVNGDIIALMTKAAYALNTFHAFNTVETTNTPVQTETFSSPLRTSGPNENSANEEQVKRQNLINKAVLHVVQLDLQDALTWEGGLIGTQNKSLQFWGKVVMALALAVAITVAAIGIALALGYTAPAFMASYIAAVQANAIVTTVLNFVASKLALDLSLAAAVTVVAAAGTLGMFGKALHMAGAPTSLKKDLDKAVTDMDTAINNTPVMRTR